MAASNITVYGVDDCEDTQRVRALLDSRGTRYTYVNIDQDREADQMVKNENEGKRRTPLVQVCVGTECRVLRVPSNKDLDAALRDIAPLESVA